METLQLTPSLLEENREQAVRVLRHYFAPMTPEGRGFTGGQWDTFDPSGTRASSHDVITSDDLLSLALLSVDVPAKAALLLLAEPMQVEVSTLLRRLDPDLQLVDVESLDDVRFAAALDLDRMLRTLPGFGPTRVAKLLARKRPLLLPVYDSVIRETLTAGTGKFWRPLHASLQADNCRLHRHLLELHQQAGLSDEVSALRVLDVLAWMDGTGYAERLAQPDADEVADDVESRERTADDA